MCESGNGRFYEGETGACFGGKVGGGERGSGLMCLITVVERDSRKDEAVVFVFIFATAGLLGWALIRPWVERWVEVCDS